MSAESTPGQKILATMLERLYASLLGGPVLNCKPHASRQRVDLAQLAAIDDLDAQRIVADLLGPASEVKLSARRPRPADAVMRADPTSLTPNDRSAREAWEQQDAVLRKLRNVADEAATYERDTGVQALYLGLPLLSVAPARASGERAVAQRRVLAPIAFVPLRLTVRTGRAPGVTLGCAQGGVDRVVPNAALLAWIERQTGTTLADVFDDAEGTQPWREIQELTAAVTRALEIIGMPAIDAETPLVAVPRADDAEDAAARVIPCAVLGLFPVSNQSLLRDMKALASQTRVEGPLERFLQVKTSAPSRSSERTLSERLVSLADPCQARAVRLARESAGLVVHGPPGTGKSQTIANIVGDHLARGERVLFVCDKRTALDVVHQRLSRLGIGSLCAVVHDPQRDQRDLYMGIREQLDALADAKPDATAPADLRVLDEEIARVHARLSEHARALSERENGGAAPSLGELTAQWLTLDVPADLAVVAEVRDVPLDRLVGLEGSVREALERGRKESYPQNPWTASLGASLDSFLAESMIVWRERLATLVAAGRELDAGPDVGAPFGDGDPVEQGKARASIGNALATAVRELGGPRVAAWLARPADDRKRARAELITVDAQLERLAGSRNEPELSIVLREQPTPASQLALWIAALTAYLAIARKWYRWFFFGRRRAASRVLATFGLGLDAGSTERVSRYLGDVRARRIVESLFEQTLTPANVPRELSDEALAARVRAHRTLLDSLATIDEAPALAAARAWITTSLAEPERHASLVAALAAAPERALRLRAFEAALTETKLFTAAFASELRRMARDGRPVAITVASLEDRIATVEGLLRIERARTEMPAAVSKAVGELLERGASPDDGWTAVRRAVLAGQISARIQSRAILRELDADGIAAAFERHRTLDAQRRDRVRDAILERWLSRQRERLLVATGSRLNGAGADLRRRLTLRGERAMRPREVIAAGRSLEGGDPLFDLRPVWMASPETVAQIFPREPLFDIVIFDEASQCRLEEAMPVLTRARRVVIAGDPRQLPPTRFFESAVVESRDMARDDSEQGLFEQQQADTEDLLAAALNLEIDQCYLDVHYRSRNADLIEFSNQAFYDARLQAIPGHPSRRATVPPIRVVCVKGVYDKRANVLEAAEVVKLVRELLARPAPPSIGIACFNLVQRDAILDALDDAAATDAEFGAKLAMARTRATNAGFEGLFVKNLENVQGDERDHMIISTTYGPDAKGKFYRRFGPLASPGGGRRLNVLVTRARSEVHIVTSIPPEAWRSLPPVPEGQVPNGGYQLFAYLQFAERLDRLYADERERYAKARVADRGSVHVNELRTGSSASSAIAQRLSRAHQLASEVHWGNDGFCVDVAIQHPTRAEDVTLGVLYDGARYDRADDAVEWDLFRTSVLEAQGWKLMRVWSPQLFRDTEHTLAAVAKASEDHVPSAPKEVAANAALN